MPWQGAGTPDDPYRIGTAAELKALADRVNAGAPFTGNVFLLTGNLDLSEYPDWVPIGRSSAKQFDGIFDGQGYALDNLYSNAGGLFGYVGSNAVIRNVGVASGEIGSDNRSFIGAIAGWSNGADFINCWNGADIRCSGWSGGIVGTALYYVPRLALLRDFWSSRFLRNRQAIACLTILLLLLIMDYGSVAYSEKMQYLCLLMLFVQADKLRESNQQALEDGADE